MTKKPLVSKDMTKKTFSEQRHDKKTFSEQRHDKKGKSDNKKVRKKIRSHIFLTVGIHRIAFRILSNIYDGVLPQ